MRPPNPARLLLQRANQRGGGAAATMHELLRPALYGCGPVPGVPGFLRGPQQQQCAHASTTADATSSSSSSSSSSGSDNNNAADAASFGRARPRGGGYAAVLTPAQQLYLTRALRVNQAGEVAAVRIYGAQTPVLVRAHPSLRPLMAHMSEQEAGHLRTFDALVARHRVRPTAMRPLWEAASSGLGWVTAAMGREAAMACTEAVETEIGHHYNGQIRGLLGMVAGLEEREGRVRARGGGGDGEGDSGGELEEVATVKGELKALIETLRRIRDEELEHLDHAVEHDAKKARPYALLTGIIRAGCRGAIWISERV